MSSIMNDKAGEPDPRTAEVTNRLLAALPHTAKGPEVSPNQGIWTCDA